MQVKHQFGVIISFPRTVTYKDRSMVKIKMCPGCIEYCFWPWWWSIITMGQKCKLYFTFIFPTKKTPSAYMISPLPYWVNKYVTQNITIVHLTLYMCKIYNYIYISFLCKIYVEIYNCSKYCLPVISYNYKINWHNWFILFDNLQTILDRS